MIIKQWMFLWSVVFQATLGKGFVYQDYRVITLLMASITSLSNFEANMDYRDVPNPLVTIKCHCLLKKSGGHTLQRLVMMVQHC